MLDECVGKWKNLKLLEEEDVAVRVVEIGGEGTSNVEEKFCLVASLISVWPYNHGALGRTMEKVWRPLKGMHYKKVRENRVLFELFSKRNYEKILEGRQWSFDKQLLIIQEFGGDIQLCNTLILKQNLSFFFFLGVFAEAIKLFSLFSWFYL